MSFLGQSKKNKSNYPYTGQTLQIDTPDGQRIILNPYIEPKQKATLSQDTQSLPYVYIPIIQLNLNSIILSKNYNQLSLIIMTQKGRLIMQAPAQLNTDSILKDLLLVAQKFENTQRVICDYIRFYRDLSGHHNMHFILSHLNKNFLMYSILFDDWQNQKESNDEVNSDHSTYQIKKLDKEKQNKFQEFVLIDSEIVLQDLVEFFLEFEQLSDLYFKQLIIQVRIKNIIHSMQQDNRKCFGIKRQTKLLKDLAKTQSLISQQLTYFDSWCASCMQDNPSLGYVYYCDSCNLGFHLGCINQLSADTDQGLKCSNCKVNQNSQNNSCVYCNQNKNILFYGEDSSLKFHLFCRIFQQAINLDQNQDQVCKICELKGQMIWCMCCQSTFHPICAYKQGYVFDIQFQSKGFISSCVYFTVQMVCCVPYSSKSHQSKQFQQTIDDNKFFRLINIHPNQIYYDSPNSKQRNNRKTKDLKLSSNKI